MKPPQFFFDRCCPVKLAKLVAVFDDDHHVRHFQDDGRFPADTEDTVWIRTLGEDDLRWVVVSMDGKILKKPHEKQALTDSKLQFFLLGSAWMQMPMEDKCWKFLKAWPDLARIANESRHRLFEVKAGSSIKIEPI